MPLLAMGGTLEREEGMMGASRSWIAPCFGTALALVVAGVGACGDSGETTTPTGTGATGAQGGGGGTGNQGGGGAGATGGIGGAGGQVGCTPTDTQSCYDGDPATNGVGICHGGTQTCDGSGEWGPCQDQQIPETEICAAVGDEDCNGVPCSEHLWSKMVGETLAQTVTGVAVDQATGRVAIVGWFQGTIDLGGGALTSAGARDIFVAVYESNGTHVWSHRYGSQAEDYGWAVAFESGGHLWVTGHFAGTINFGFASLSANGSTVDGFLLELDTANAGAHLYSRQLSNQAAQVLPTGEKHPYGLAIDASDNIYIAGEYSGGWGCGPLCPVNPTQDYAAFAAKYQPDGTQTWRVGFDTTNHQQAWPIVIDSLGSPIIGGVFYDGITIGATSFVAPAAMRYGFVAKLDPTTGAGVWARSFGDNSTSSAQYVRGLAVRSDDSIVVSGWSGGAIRFDPSNNVPVAGGVDAFLALYSSGNTFVWGKTFGDASDQQAYGVAVDSNDDLALVGAFRGGVDLGGGSLTSAGGWDLFVAKFQGATGNHLWSKGFGGASDDFLIAVDTNATNQIFAVGQASSSLDFGGGSLTNQGGIDGIIAAFWP
jgi:hypothetical protein